MIVAGFMSGTSMDALDCSIVDIFIDSNLNFPHGRAISQTTINILFALIILQSYSYEK